MKKKQESSKKNSTSYKDSLIIDGENGVKETGVMLHFEEDIISKENQPMVAEMIADAINKLTSRVKIYGIFRDRDEGNAMIFTALGHEDDLNKPNE